MKKVSYSSGSGLEFVEFIVGAHSHARVRAYH